MESPIEMVRRFCAAWSDNMGAAELAAFFTEDAVYHNIPQEPVTGRENIANTIASVLRPGPPGIESIDFRVINIAANGPVVMTERIDVFKLPGKSFELPVHEPDGIEPQPGRRGRRVARASQGGAGRRRRRGPGEGE